MRPGGGAGWVRSTTDVLLPAEGMEGAMARGSVGEHKLARVCLKQGEVAM